MATFDLTEYLEDDGITLEGVRSPAHPDGRAYTFASPSFEVGLWLRNLIEFGQRAALGADVEPEDLAEQVGKLVLNDDEELDLYKRVMGDTFDELAADGVSWERVGRIFTLLLRKWGNNMPIEATIAEAAEAGKAATPANRAERRASEKPAKKPSARSASPKGGARSNRASGATPALTTGRTSTRSSTTSAKPTAAAAV